MRDRRAATRCAVGVVIASFGVVACAGSPDGPQEGIAEVTLSTGGARLVAANLWIRSPFLPVSFTKDVDVSSASETIPAYQGSLEVGDYDVNIRGTTDARGSCFGSGNFKVLARSTAQVSVLLDCTPESSVGDGEPDLIGGTNPCLLATDIVTETARATVGVPMRVGLRTGVGGGGALSWAADSGTFSASHAAATEYTCVEPGRHTVVLTVTLTGTICDQALSKDIDCDP